MRGLILLVGLALVGCNKSGLSDTQRDEVTDIAYDAADDSGRIDDLESRLDDLETRLRRAELAKDDLESRVSYLESQGY